jgi:pimeloyl-ACP methyl ester carboxylesterase
MQTIARKDKITFVDFGGEGPVIHFAHANGYPPEVYHRLLTPLTKHYRVIAMYLRPLWPGTIPEETRKWNDLAGDLIQFLEENKLKSTIAMGHSLGGAVSLFAADLRPDLFERLIFIDPVFLPLQFISWQYFLPNSMMKKIVPPAKVAVRRRDQWESQEAMFESFRKKKVFKNITDEVLWDMVKLGTKPMEEGGITLCYSKAWEAQIYSIPPMVWPPLRRLKVPSLGIKAEFTDVISPKCWSKWQRYQPNAEYMEFKDTGHLLPLEKPAELANEILKHLKSYS